MTDETFSSHGWYREVSDHKQYLQKKCAHRSIKHLGNVDTRIMSKKVFLFVTRCKCPLFSPMSLSCLTRERIGSIEIGEGLDPQDWRCMYVCQLVCLVFYQQRLGQELAQPEEVGRKNIRRLFRG